MRVWSAANSTLLSVSRCGFVDVVPLLNLKRSSLFHSSSVGSTSLPRPQELKTSQFLPFLSDSHIGRSFVASSHEATMRLIDPSAKQSASTEDTGRDHGNEREHRHRDQRRDTRPAGRIRTLPIYLIPGLTSFFFYSTNQKPSASQSLFPFVVSTGVYCIPKDATSPVRSEREKCTPLGCGEDSYCLAENDESVLLAVADGVGGWRKKGVNPAFFSQTLMHHTGELVRTPDPKLSSDPDSPRTLIRGAFWRLVKDFTSGRKRPFGSSTACVVLIDRESGRLKFGNLGDSGFVLLTPVDAVEGVGTRYRVKFKSESQQHRFNMPYQITLAPPAGTVTDTTDLIATDATARPPKELRVETGDIILLMTDGVLDNIFDDELEELVSSSITTLSRKKTPEEVPTLLARDVALKAHAFSLQERRESPFTVEARKHGLSYVGGKQDDITVVAAIIYPPRK